MEIYISQLVSLWVSNKFLKAAATVQFEDSSACTAHGFSSVSSMCLARPSKNEKQFNPKNGIRDVWHHDAPRGPCSSTIHIFAW